MRLGANPDLTLVVIDTRVATPPEPEPGADVDTSLLQRPPGGEHLIFISGAPPLRIDTLGLESGRATLRPGLQGGQHAMWIRADILEDLALRFPFATLEIHTRMGLLRFPTYLLDILRGAKAAIAQERLEYDQVYVRITLTDRSSDPQLHQRVQQVFPGGQVLAPLVDVTVELLRRSSHQVFFTVREFTRPLDWIQTIMPQTGIVRYGGFWFNPAPARIEFAPHRAHGPNEVVIRSIYTGVHGVVNNGAIVTDLSEDSWGFGRAAVAANKGLIQATGGRISPGTSITRAEFAQLLSFALQLPGPGFMPDFYVDVPPTSWAFDPIARARYAGLLDGEYFFRPGEAITRQEMISMAASRITAPCPTIFGTITTLPHTTYWRCKPRSTTGCFRASPTAPSAPIPMRRAWRPFP
jgi:hypothetical protein